MAKMDNRVVSEMLTKNEMDFVLELLKLQNGESLAPTGLSESPKSYTEMFIKLYFMKAQICSIIEINPADESQTK